MFNVHKSMGVSSQEKVDLAAYHFKDVSKVRYEQWKYERPVIQSLITQGAFKMAFLDRFFPLELRETNMQ